MKKNEAERKIRYLCSRWASEKGIATDGTVDPNFTEFYLWIQKQGYAEVFDFRGQGGAMAYVREWFDEEFRQSWKN